jgi:hypothetical protein
MNKSDLRVDWATHAAAKHAVENWHYSERMPASKLLKVGAWESGRFIGVVIFGGGGGNSTHGGKYGLKKAGDVCELVRVALRDHVTPVSRIVAIALRFLNKSNPNLRMVVSFADTSQGHHGGIYQAGNWVYTGLTAPDREFHVKGQILHPRTINARGWQMVESWLRDNVDPSARLVKTPGKHRYLMPLDADMRASIMHLSKPYPKRVKQATTDDQSAGRRGGTDPHAPQEAGNGRS